MTDLIEVKTADLAGPALDWVIAQIEGIRTLMLSPRKGETKKPFAIFGSLALSVGGDDQYSYAPSTCWHCGGPLIDKHYPTFSFADGLIRAEVILASGAPFSAIAPNYLVATSRAIVAARHGDTVQVPKELIR